MAPFADPFNLNRFVAAQRDVFDHALAELCAGQKRTHWMWFIFPQIAGLGSSPTAAHYAISGRAEAVAYLHHDRLGERLRAATQAVTQTSGRSIEEIFGYPDNLKFHSSVTLFAQVAPPGETIFQNALDRHFAGRADAATLALL
jgi:uncharacterized protein (DUF1810 family)